MWLGFELLAVGSTLRAIWIAWLVVVGLGFGVAEVRRCCGGGGKGRAKEETKDRKAEGLFFLCFFFFFFFCCFFLLLFLRISQATC